MKYCVLILICMFTILQINNLSADVLNPDLVLYFDFEEFDGDTVLEKSGREYNGKINGNVMQSEDGRFGKAAHFTIGGFLDLNGPNINPDDIPTEGMSVVAWINVEGIADMAIFNARAGNSVWLVHPEARGDGNYRWLNRSAENQTLFDIKAGKNQANDWIHYAGTFSREEEMAYLYINGEEVANEKARANGKIAGDWDMGARVGYNIDNKRPFNGLMDELNIWKRGLTQEEVQSIMNYGMVEHLAVDAQGKLTTTWGKLKSSGR